MFLRLVLFASLAWLSFGFAHAGAPTTEKNGSCIDPAGYCHAGSSPADDADRGWAIDPNG